jgi:hypothetical protein
MVDSFELDEKRSAGTVLVLPNAPWGSKEPTPVDHYVAPESPPTPRQLLRRFNAREIAEQIIGQLDPARVETIRQLATVQQEARHALDSARTRLATLSSAPPDDADLDSLTQLEGQRAALTRYIPVLEVRSKAANDALGDAIRVELDNGSRIIALPGKAEGLRGFSAVNLLICDEAAYIPDSTYFSVRPMLATSNGRIVIMSTPFGRRGFFNDTWANGGEAWHREEIRATQNPRISAQFLAEERRALGVWYAQEYENAFLDNQFAVFAYDTVQAALSDQVTPLFGVQQHEAIHTRA